MVDYAQILLTGIIIVLTILLLILGVQSFFVLTEFRKTIRKANTLLDDVKGGANIAKIVGTIVALLLGKNLGKNFVEMMTKDRNKVRLGGGELKEVVKKDPKRLVRKFFRRSKT